MTTFGPYSPIKQAGSIYFIAGQVGVNSETKSAEADITSQVRQVLDNLKHLLEDNGLQIKDVVKTTVFLKSMADFAAMNEIYATYFQDARPARSCVAVADLPHVAGGTELLVEIEAIAYKSETTGEKHE